MHSLAESRTQTSDRNCALHQHDRQVQRAVSGAVRQEAGQAVKITKQPSAAGGNKSQSGAPGRKQARRPSLHSAQTQLNAASKKLASKRCTWQEADQVVKLARQLALPALLRNVPQPGAAGGRGAPQQPAARQDVRGGVSNAQPVCMPSACAGFGVGLTEQQAPRANAAEMPAPDAAPAAAAAAAAARPVMLCSQPAPLPLTCCARSSWL